MPDEKPRPWTMGENGQPLLKAVRCAECGTQMFPAQTYGCLVCGAHGDALVGAALAPVGRLITFATVWTHQTRRLPFTLGDVQLDGGPVVRARLSDDLTPKIGQRMAGAVVEDGGPEELVFVEEAAR